MTPDLESPEQSLTPDEILELLRTRLTVDPSVVQQALGIGEWALDGAIKRGVCPAIDLGPGAKRKPIPSWWVLKMLGLQERGHLQQLREPLLQLQEGERDAAG
jgi:hypothetical protein